MLCENEILSWLKEEDTVRLGDLWASADRARRENVGDEIHLRGLIEISNHCARSCAYCGLAIWRMGLIRYRMSPAEIVSAAQTAQACGYGTVVMQSGEDFGITVDWLSDVIRRVKAETSLAVTLSLGERKPEELRAWRAAGADRYLLRFETGNRELLDLIHPSLKDHRSDRFAVLGLLDELGYEVGSGVMIGIPGQTYQSLARDIFSFAELGLDMIGVGPYIPNPGSPLATGRIPTPDVEEEQVPNDELTGYKVIALTRLVCPETNIPSTTAFSTLNDAEGRELGLMRGANVIMPNVTPMKYRQLYQIYPGKSCLAESPDDFSRQLAGRIEQMGRRVGRGPGASPHYMARRKSANAADERNKPCALSQR